VGTHNFCLSPQPQFRNLKEALPQSQFRNFLRNVAPQLQLRNRNFLSSQLESFTSAIFGIFLAVE
jgi:phytoene/squalene synthetase